VRRIKKKKANRSRSVISMKGTALLGGMAVEIVVNLGNGEVHSTWVERNLLYDQGGKTQYSGGNLPQIGWLLRLISKAGGQQAECGGGRQET